MFAYEPILSIFILLLIIWLWQDAWRAKELAIHAGKRACRRAEVEFLDDTVVFRRFRWQPDARGRKSWQRDYDFEFSVDGSRRYRGCVSLQGRRIREVYMEPYHQNEDPFIKY